MPRNISITVIVLATLLGVSFMAFVVPAAAADDTEANLSVSSGDDGMISQQNEACEGAPQMSQTSITSPEDQITADQPGVVEANFRVDPVAPEDCDVNVDLEFSFAESGFQFGGGAEWDTSTTDLVATTFEDLDPGEIRDIRAEIETNGAEPGDEVTVIADYEIWYDGERENSVQQSGIRHTIEVEEPTESESGATSNGDSPPGIFDFLEDNLALVGVVLGLLIAVIGLAKREPIVQVITGNN